MPTTASHVWRPSAARTITLDAFIPVPRGTTATAPSPLSWPLKDPGDLLDYQFDIAPALIGNDGDAIATLDIAISPSNPGDLALTATAADGTRAVSGSPLAYPAQYTRSHSPSAPRPAAPSPAPSCFLSLPSPFHPPRPHPSQPKPARP